jgi:aminopeptidase
MDKIDNYIELLLTRCLVFKKSKSLFINYEKEYNQDFVDRIIIKAHKLGIHDIYLNDNASKQKHDILSNCKINDIEKLDVFNNIMWDVYAKKNAAFLMIESELPHLMDDIDQSKVAKARLVMQKTKPVYKEKQLTDKISWCICAYPNVLWAKDLFGDRDDAYDYLLNLILDMCMCDRENAVEAWNKYIETSKKRISKLNEMNIRKLHYTNSLGTDLEVEFPTNYVWCGADNAEGMLVNMPSYEIFSSPDKNKTKGIVYSSKPLIYNGALINNFWLKFIDGRVVDFDAEVGKDVLKEIINGDENSNYLGECALVNYDSPISNTHIVFDTTLFDENASCHLALGAGFPETIKKYQKYTNEEIFAMGINNCNNHVDFMIGTSDLKIIGETDNGLVTVFEKGNFVI